MNIEKVEKVQMGESYTNGKAVKNHSNKDRLGLNFLICPHSNTDI